MKDIHQYIPRILFVLALAAAAAMSYTVSNAAGLPLYEGFQLSLLQQPNPVIAMAIVALLLLLGVTVATLIAGSTRAEAGFAAGVLGLLGLSIRGGTMRSVLQASDSPDIFIRLAGEAAILGLLLLAAWFIPKALAKTVASKLIVPAESQPIPLGQALASIGIQSLIFAVLVFLLGRSELKLQAIGSVAAAAVCAVMAVRMLYPLQQAWVYVPATMIVAVVGYLLNYSDATGLATGHITGRFGSFASILPIDYLLAGPSAALITFWSTPEMASEEDAEEVDPDQTNANPA